MKMQSTSHRSSILRFALGLVLGPLLLVPQLAGQTTPPPTPAKPPTRVRVKLDGFELSANSGKSPNQIGGASRDLGTPTLFAPAFGKCFTTTPYFHWAKAEADGKVTFTLSTVSGQAVYETVTTADSLTYPSDAPALMPGSSYRWTVVPENDLLGGAPAKATFLIVTGAERQKIQDELKPVDGIAKVNVFVSHRLWYDAVRGYSDLLERMPSDQSARTGRAQLYDQLAVTKSLADADWLMVH